MERTAGTGAKVRGLSDLSSIIKAYDVRGVVPDEWDEETSRAIGAAFAEFVIADSGAVKVKCYGTTVISVSLVNGFASPTLPRTCASTRST